MVIFHRYVSLPKGTPTKRNHSPSLERQNTTIIDKSCVFPCTKPIHHGKKTHAGNITLFITGSCQELVVFHDFSKSRGYLLLGSFGVSAWTSCKGAGCPCSPDTRWDVFFTNQFNIGDGHTIGSTMVYHALPQYKNNSKQLKSKYLRVSKCMHVMQWFSHPSQKRAEHC